MKRVNYLYLQLAMLVTGVALDETTPSAQETVYFLKVTATQVDHEQASVECNPFSIESPEFPKLAGTFIFAFDVGFASLPAELNVKYLKTESVGYADGAFLFHIMFDASSSNLNPELIEDVVLAAFVAATSFEPKADGVEAREINEEVTTIAPPPTSPTLPNRECRRCLLSATRSRSYGRSRFSPLRNLRPHFFLVDSENCADQSSNCEELYGFESQCGCFDEKECPIAFCVSPSPPGLLTTPANELRVLAYNVLGVEPILFPHSGQRERTCRIPRIIAEQIGNVDVIVFSEVVLGGCWFDQRASLRDILREHGFRHSTSTVCGDSVSNGGVFIASRWPIVDNQLAPFTVTLPSSDFGISRGVAYARIKKTVSRITRYYNVFGTHMHPLDEVTSNAIRISQAQQILALKEEIGVSTFEPVIYAGDMNTNLYNAAEEPEDVFDALNSIVPEIIGPLNYTFDPVNNELAFQSTRDFSQEWIDYTLYDLSHLNPHTATMQSLALQSETPISVCFKSNSYEYVPHFSSECIEVKSISDLSDHYAVLGEFIFD